MIRGKPENGGKGCQEPFWRVFLRGHWTGGLGGSRGYVAIHLGSIRLVVVIADSWHIGVYSIATRLVR